MFAARPRTKTLGDNSQHDVQAAPGEGKAIEVVSLVVGSDQATATVVTIKEGTTAVMPVPLRANSDCVAIPCEGWVLPENTALTAQQSNNGTNAYVTAITRIIPAQELQD